MAAEQDAHAEIGFYKGLPHCVLGCEDNLPRVPARTR